MADSWKPEITEDDVSTSLRKKFGSDDFQLDTWRLISLMEDGKLGYLGDHYQIVGTVRRPAGAADTKAFSFFVKSKPANPVQLKTVERTGAFRKEMLFYKLLAEKFAEVVPMKRGPDFQPFLYPGVCCIKEDCLIMEDLSPFKFSSPPLNKAGSMDLEHIEMVITDMARMHAASLVVEERAGKKMSELYPELMFETFFDGDPTSVLCGWHQASIKLAVAIVPHLERYNKDPALVKRIQAALPDLLPQIFTALKPWPGVRNVMVHGDLWVNNLMYRYQDGKPVELSIVDFQLMRYTPPAHDLVMCVLFCTDQAFQDKYFSRLTRLHWDCMAAVLREAGCDPDKVLPWSDFEDSVKKMWKYGLIQMSMEHPLALCPSEVMDPILVDAEKYHQHFNVDRSETLIKVFNDERFFFRQRFTETMTRLIDGYVLKSTE